MHVEIFESQNYKEGLRHKLKTLQQKQKSLTLKKVATLIPVQYTYLSKFFNDSATHLSEDHLFSLCRILELPLQETEFVLLQRSHEVAQDPERKEFLLSKIKRERETKQLNLNEKSFDGSSVENELAYFFNPFCVLVHAALFIPRYFHAPLDLAEVFQLTISEIKEVMKTLALNGFIDLDEDGLTPTKMHQKSLHYGPDHPLMRTHQNVLKTMANAKFLTLAESEKFNFLVTFSADEHGFDQIRTEFRSFLKKVEGIVGASNDQKVYQLSFDLFPWT